MQTDFFTNPTFNAITHAVLQKVQRCCPDSVSLIAVYGSAATGDIHAYSDLDLLIITKNAAAQVLAKAFVLEGIGYDIYCTPWERIEQEASHPHAHISRWMDCRILWQASQQETARLYALRSKAAELLLHRSEADTLAAAQDAFLEAYPLYARLMYTQALSQSRMLGGEILYLAEAALCLYNRTYYRRGVSRIYEELSAFAHLPQQFVALAESIAKASDLAALRTAVTALMEAMDTFLTPAAAPAAPATTAALQKGLIGSLEEMISNWRGKLQQAAGSGNAHLALMSIGACHLMMQEICTPLGLTPPDVPACYDPADLQATANNFDKALASFALQYKAAALQPAVYPDIAAFSAAYLCE